MHIPCDAASRSEIVIPLFTQSARTDGAYLLGVLDLDSPKLARFGTSPYTDQTSYPLHEGVTRDSGFSSLSFE